MIDKNFPLVLVRNIKIKCTFESAFYHDSLAIEKAKRMFRNCSKNRIKQAGEPFVFKKSIDARDKNSIMFLYTVAFPVHSDSFKLQNIEFDTFWAEKPDFECKKNLSSPPVVDTRQAKVNKYWESGTLDENTNVQFGEGGAGTFSDGKLLTRISDKLCRFVMEEFVKHGAPDEIMYLAKPHVGTDNLRNVVKSIREEIVSLGGKVLFDTKLESVVFDGVSVSRVILSNGCEIDCSALFLCIGHSARDTVVMLKEKGVTVEPKPFSVGVRIEHKRVDIDKALYGDFAGCQSIGAASYTLSKKIGSRSVYSFCMCPGGVVVASASENGQIVTNGMSYYSRDGENSNSAIAVSVDTSDYGNTVESAIAFQHDIERKAFEVAGNNGSAPIQCLSDFLGKDNCVSGMSAVNPTYTGKTSLRSVSDVFPEFITDSLRDGLVLFEKDIEGFTNGGAILTFPETRTSSPVKIPRDNEYLANGFSNLYPCGEGAGYAGGITSAAVDGLRAALAFMKNS